jgi:hypothetical protein
MADMTVTKPLVLAAAAVLALAGCSATPATNSPAAPPAASSAQDPLLAAYDLAGLEGREIVDRLDRTPVEDRQPDLLASVRPGELLLSDSGSDQPTAVDLPEGEFYLSIAPYVEQTHDCFFHSLTTCRGELAGEPVHVSITDRGTGEVLVDETTETFDNGFVGYWLPVGIDATVQVAHDGRVGTQHIATGPEDPTCLTTLRLT